MTPSPSQPQPAPSHTMPSANQAPPVDRSQRASIDAAPGFRRENTVVACDGIARPQSEHIATGLPTAQPGFCHCLVLNPEP